MMILLLGCSESGKPGSCIGSITDSLGLDQTKNIIIYTVNPNDCLNCLIGFNALNKHLSEKANPQVYVFSVEREIEKKGLEKKIADIDLKPSKNKAVLWSKDLFNRINGSLGSGLSLSMIAIYNPETDSVLYSRPVREISDQKELLDKL